MGDETGAFFIGVIVMGIAFAIISFNLNSILHGVIGIVIFSSGCLGMIWDYRRKGG